MIELIEGKHAPEVVRALAPDAPWFIIEEPGPGNHMVLADIRHLFMQYLSINFVQHPTRIDGKIIYVRV